MYLVRKSKFINREIPNNRKIASKNYVQTNVRVYRSQISQQKRIHTILLTEIRDTILLPKGIHR